MSDDRADGYTDSHCHLYDTRGVRRRRRRSPRRASAGVDDDDQRRLRRGHERQAIAIAAAHDGV